MAGKEHCLVCGKKKIDDTNRPVTCYSYYDKVRHQELRVCLCSIHYGEVYKRYGLPAPREVIGHYSDDL